MNQCGNTIQSDFRRYQSDHCFVRFVGQGIDQEFTLFQLEIVFKEIEPQKVELPAT